MEGITNLRVYVVEINTCMTIDTDQNNIKEGASI